jgi:hypothetical protein
MKTRILGLGSLVAAGLALTLGGGAAPAASGGTGGSGCLAHHPNYIEDTFEVQYTSGCTATTSLSSTRFRRRRGRRET